MTRTAPEFWWRTKASGTAILLSPIARIWSTATLLRMAKPPSYRPPVPVICVGNLVVGGAGKTPTAIALARAARARGLKAGLLSAGYGGDTRTPVLVDAASDGSERVGDEALLLAAVAPTVVARDRAAGARRLVEAGVDIIIMDDGFQNPAVRKDLSLVVVDAASGIGNGMVIPAGPLRAPVADQMRAADALLLVGEGTAADPIIRAAARAGRATLRARLRPTRSKEWRKEPILAFAGIGHPEKFFASLIATHAPVAKTLSFPDHYSYGEVDALKLMQMADAGGLRLVTTEKDFVRLAGKGGALAKLRERVEPFHVILEFENPTAITEMIGEAVRNHALARSD